MTHSPAKIVAEYLQEGSNALFTGPDGPDWPLFISSLPDEGCPTNAGAVYDTTGVKKGRMMGDGKNLFTYGVQVKVRASEYDVGWEQASAVADLLERWHADEITIDGSIYLVDSFLQTSSVLSLGKDEQRRVLFAVNGLLMVDQTA